MACQFYGNLSMRVEVVEKISAAREISRADGQERVTIL